MWRTALGETGVIGLSEEEVRSRGGDEEEEMRLREGEMVADS